MWLTQGPRAGSSRRAPRVSVVGLRCGHNRMSGDPIGIESAGEQCDGRKLLTATTTQEPGSKRREGRGWRGDSRRGSRAACFGSPDRRGNYWHKSSPAGFRLFRDPAAHVNWPVRRRPRHPGALRGFTTRGMVATTPEHLSDCTRAREYRLRSVVIIAGLAWPDAGCDDEELSALEAVQPYDDVRYSRVRVFEGVCVADFPAGQNPEEVVSSQTQELVANHYAQQLTAQGWTTSRAGRALLHAERGSLRFRLILWGPFGASGRQYFEIDVWRAMNVVPE